MLKFKGDARDDKRRIEYIRQFDISVSDVNALLIYWLIHSLFNDKSDRDCYLYYRIRNTNMFESYINKELSEKIISRPQFYYEIEMGLDSFKKRLSEWLSDIYDKNCIKDLIENIDIVSFKNPIDLIDAISEAYQSSFLDTPFAGYNSNFQRNDQKSEFYSIYRRYICEGYILSEQSLLNRFGYFVPLFELLPETETVYIYDLISTYVNTYIGFRPTVFNNKFVKKLRKIDEFYKREEKIPTEDFRISLQKYVVENIVEIVEHIEDINTYALAICDLFIGRKGIHWLSNYLKQISLLPHRIKRQDTIRKHKIEIANYFRDLRKKSNYIQNKR
ncbi:MAG: hypothetical protein ACK5JU_00410 [Bacteroidales bacterium]